MTAKKSTRGNTRSRKRGKKKTRARNTLWVTDPAEFVACFGPALLTAFSRCFVHADRLMSLADFVVTSAKVRGQDSVAHTRNLHTMYWFVCGTLWEAANAALSLGKAGIGRHVADLAKWRQLRTLVVGWQKNKWLRVARNKAGFHIDPEPIEAGLRSLAAKGERVLFHVADGPSGLESSLEFGLTTLIAGLKIEEEEFYAFVSLVQEGHFAFSQLVQELFADAAKKAGLELVPDAIPPAPHETHRPRTRREA